MYLSELIEAVREIDVDAANYLDNEAPFLDTYQPKRFNDSENHWSIITVMVWSGTPQGRWYWSDLFDKLI